MKIEQFYCPHTNFTKNAHRDITQVNPSLVLTCARLHVQYGTENCKKRLFERVALYCDLEKRSSFCCTSFCSILRLKLSFTDGVDKDS